MVIPHRDARGRAMGLGVALATAVTIALLTGCSQHASMDGGFSNQGWTQLQFFSPPGADVQVRCMTPYSRQITPENSHGHRLELSPEECCIYNLAPGSYEFKYTSADGLPGVSVYGELVVEHANSHEAQVFQRRSFVPVSLPSEFYEDVAYQGDAVLPYVGERFRYAIDAYDLERLKHGDVIEKVFFVADLERAEKMLDMTQCDIAACERELEYANARFNLAYQDFQIDVGSSSANFWGTDRKFIKWERRRRSLEQGLDDLVDLERRLKALIRGDHVIIRRGMLVLATEEVVEGHTDVVDAADDLGEVLLVMRLGGRHMHWGNPRGDLVAYEQE